MKLAKSLLLGTAAGLAAVAGAQAADLPARKAAPVEYVRVCSTYGTGFFYVPGTESCLRISGRVRADVRYIEPLFRGNDAIGFRARGRVNFDHRTATAYGLLRTYVRYEITRDSGSPFGQTGTIGTNTELQQAFIQFGGLTAGRVTSFFSNPDLPTNHMGTLRFDDAPDVTLFAYTYSFGNGFSATLSIEDAQERRVNNALGFPLFGSGAPVGSVFASPAAFTYGGQRIPDVVANIRYAGTWGGLQLSGAVRQISEVGAARVVPGTTPAVALPLFADEDFGFAVSLSGFVNLPALGAGDSAWFAATYTDGAIGYINGGTARNPNQNIGAGVLSLPAPDAYVNPFTGDFETVKAYSIAGGLTHNWTPQFQTGVFGSWARFDAPSGAAYTIPVTAATVAAGTAGLTTGIVDFNEYRVGINSRWFPVAGLQLGVEALYTRVDPKGRVQVRDTGAGGAFARSTGGEDIWEGRLRIQRDF